MRRFLVVLVAVWLAWWPGLSALQHVLEDADLDEAIDFAMRTSDAERIGFHRGYVFAVNAGAVASLSFVTPYRRIVLEAEQQRRQGTRLWGRREAQDVLRRAGPGVEIVADVVFHPQNALAKVPTYDLRVVRKDGPALPGSAPRTTARYGLQSVPTPSAPPFYPFPPPSLPIGTGAEPLLGAWVSQNFNLTVLDPRAFIVVGVREEEKELATIAVDLSRIR